MLKLHIIQAKHGDCFILECGSKQKPMYVLIDGGPAKVYETHLKHQLQDIKASGGALDLMVLSHVDNDHVLGLLDLVNEVTQQRLKHKPETIGIKKFWFNSFSKTIGKNPDLEKEFRSFYKKLGSHARSMTHVDNAMKGIKEGHKLYMAVAQLKIPLNPEFSGDIIVVKKPTSSILFGNVKMYIVGPTNENIKELQEKWLKWLKKHRNLSFKEPVNRAMADLAIENLSSIMLYIQDQGHSILLAGDGRGDHLIDGLKETGLLSEGSTLHVDVLKLPHHGSDRNVTREFFDAITADIYVISGRKRNPDYRTLVWIVEAANEARRSISIIATNPTGSIRSLLNRYPPEDYGYSLSILDETAHSMLLEVVP